MVYWTKGGMDMNTIDRIREEKIIAIMRGLSVERAKQAAQILMEEGLPLIEVTFDQKSADHADTLDAIRALAAMGVCVGAGTVLTVRQVELAAQAGANYIISPDTSREVIEKTKELGLISMPGALTPTEIVQAWRWGADFVKIFPSSGLGAGYIKAVTAPLSHIPVLAVGGVTPENLGEFMKAGACGAGIGGNLVNAKADLDTIRMNAKAFARAREALA